VARSAVNSGVGQKKKAALGFLTEDHTDGGDQRIVAVSELVTIVGLPALIT